MKRFISYAGVLAAACILALASCSKKTDYLQFLYDYMPLPDSLVFPRKYWENNVAKTLEVRDRMKWDIPEREFLHFVLPLRVNNENLDDFRTVYADSLCDRVAGMSIGEAALEINHWCHERATYVPSDGRTLGPMALIRSGVGRCGEESVLAVAALRAAGIPARQVYTPRWAHTDDNHAWVEVYVDGGWHFMGACEPEPVLDLAWFNSSVSRAMLLHTKAFGDYDGPEDVISRTSAYTEINVIKGYIASRRTTVTVVDTLGKPVAGAAVEFKIYNSAEFYTVASYITDADGQASLDTGLGDIVVWASRDDCFGIGVVSGESGKVVLDKTVGKRYSFDLDIVPPVENALPDNSDVEQKKINAERLEEENRIRLAMPHPRTAAPGLFLTRKDEIDVPQEVIDEAMEPGHSDDRYIVSPRISREMLMPYRREILSSGIDTLLHSPADIASWVRENIRIEYDRNPQELQIPPVAVWRSRISDPASRDIFFVAMCRTLGYAARLGRGNAKPQYRSGDDWVTVDFEQDTQEIVEQGRLVTSYDAAESFIRKPGYFSQYTIARIEDGSTRSCGYSASADGNNIETGYFMMTSGTRLADGSVLAHVEMFSVNKDESVEIPIILRRSDDRVAVIGSIDAERKFLADGDETEKSILDATGRGYFLLCVMGSQDEPTIHARGLVSGIAPILNEWGRKVVILGDERPEGLDNAVFGTDTDEKIAGMLRNMCGNAGARLPLIAVADSFGRVVYFSQGYNTSLGEQLIKTIEGL